MSSGCGSKYTVSAAGIGTFQASTDAVEFGTVTVGQTAESSVTLVNQGTAAIQVSDVKLAGNGFAVTNGSSVPFSVAAGGTYVLAVQFRPKANGDSTGQLTISSTSTTSPSLKIKLHGKGAASGTSSPVLSTFSCSQSSFTGAGSDACTVTLSTAAGTGGLSVSLSSSNSAVSLPGSVAVAAGAISAGFTATVSAVTTAQNATLTASAGGTAQTYSIALGAALPGLTLSTASLNFGSVTMNSASSPQSVTLISSGAAPLRIYSAAVSGAGFTVSGMSFPATLNPGQTAALTVTFAPMTTGTASGSIAISDNASPSTAVLGLSGTGVATAGVLSRLTCTTASFTGSGSDFCTITLTAPAGNSGLAVAVASNNTALIVPASVTVPAGSSSVGFSATVSAVSTTQSATLTASAGGASKTVTLQLNAAVPTLSVGTTSVSFGDVTLNTTATQSITLASSGTSAVTVNSASVTGAGFTLSGLSLPVTLNPGQAAALNVTFDPTATGTASGQVTISSNSSTSPTATVSLSGTGVAASYQVQLAWLAPSSSPDPVAGYNVYRAPSGTGSYSLLNSAPNVSTAYSDTKVQNGLSYDYFVKSVDSSGVESVASNTTTVTIP